MRKYDVAYVPNPPHYTKPKDYKDMDLKELKRIHIDTCAKSGGLIGNCSTCGNQCVYGKQAIALMQGKTAEDSIPLYDGLTLIERAKKENKERKEQKITITKSKDGKRIYIDGWYDLAVASGDPVAWVMEHYNVTKISAQRKLCSWRSAHKETKSVAAVKTIEATSLTANMETKIKTLQEEQNQAKQEMEEALKHYEELKQKYESYNEKVYTLLSALEIIKE